MTTTRRLPVRRPRSAGIPCRREPDVEPDKDALVFEDGTDRAKVGELLEGYEQAKGS